MSNLNIATVLNLSSNDHLTTFIIVPNYVCSWLLVNYFSQVISFCKIDFPQFSCILLHGTSILCRKPNERVCFIVADRGDNQKEQVRERNSRGAGRKEANGRRKSHQEATIFRKGITLSMILACD